MTVIASQLIGKVGLEGSDKTKTDLKDIGKHAQETESSFKKLREQVARGFEFGTGMQLAQIPGSIFDFFKEQAVDIVKAGADQQQIMAQTTQALKSTHNASGMTAASINDLADAFAKTTKFSDDTTQSAENLLLTFTNIGKDTFPAATKAVLDLSQAMGQDTKESAIQLGKALNDPATGMSALQRVGVTFSQTQKDLIKGYMQHGDIAKAQKVILQELSKEFGGSAEAAGKTFGGQLAVLHNRLDQVKEKIGTALLPILTDFLGYVEQHILPRLDDFSTWFQRDGIPKIQEFGDWFQKTGIPALQDFGGKVSTVVGWLAQFVGWMQQGSAPAQAVKLAIEGIGLAIAGVKLGGFLNDLNKGIGNIITTAGDMKNAFTDFIGWFGDTFLSRFKSTSDLASKAETGIGTTMKTTVASDVAEGAAKAELAEAGIGAEAVKVEGTVATASAGMKASLAGVIGLYGVLLAGVPIVAQKVRDQAGPLADEIARWKKANPGQDIPPYLRKAAHDAGVPGYASGVLGAPGGWSIVGERGPEAMFVPPGASILPSGMSPSAFGGGSNQPIILSIDGVQFARVIAPYTTNHMRYSVGSTGW